MSGRESIWGSGSGCNEDRLLTLRSLSCFSEEPEAGHAPKMPLKGTLRSRGSLDITSVRKGGRVRTVQEVTVSGRQDRSQTRPFSIAFSTARERSLTWSLERMFDT